MTRNVPVIGTMTGDHRGRLTKGSSTSVANSARQNANSNPRFASGQESKQGERAKKPLELHMTAASMIISRPLVAEDLSVVADLSIVTLPATVDLYGYLRPAPYRSRIRWPDFLFYRRPVPWRADVPSKRAFLSSSQYPFSPPFAPRTKSP